MASHAQTHVPAPAHGASHCLLRELERADPQTTVAQLRVACATPGLAADKNMIQAPPKPAISDAVSPNQASTDTQTPGQDLLRTGISAPQLAALLQKPDAQRSLVEHRVVSEIRASQQEFALLPHRPNFILPISSHSRRNPTTTDAREPLETQFQISFKFPLTEPLLGGRVLPFFAYTGRAWWQVYDGERSRPFREYNHEPELFAALAPIDFELAGWRQRLSTVGFAHHSNGRSPPQSRSWNRLFVEAYVDRSDVGKGSGQWASLKLWKRLPENPKASPSDAFGDDNPDISRYLGHGELKLGRVTEGGHNFTLMARKSFARDGKGAVQMDWSRPTGYSPALRWHVQGFAGYGDSLIDYNQRVNRLSLGLMLNDWF